MRILADALKDIYSVTCIILILQIQFYSRCFLQEVLEIMPKDMRLKVSTILFF